MMKRTVPSLWSKTAALSALLPCFLLVISGCGSKSIEIPQENLPPSAIIIPSLTSVTVGDEVTLNGSFSFDLNADTVTYSWYECDYYVRNIDEDFDCGGNRETGLFRVEGEREGLEVGEYATGATQSIWPPESGSYTYILVVNDGEEDSDPAWVTITASELPEASQPVAVAIASPASAPPGTGIVLDGSNSVATAEGRDISEYQWYESATNPEINLIQRATGLPYALGATQAIWPSTAGVYNFTLVVVDDGGGSSASPTDYNSRVRVVINQAPTADAGSDQIVRRGDLVNLDGSGSSDPNGDSLTYTWTFASIPSSSAASLSDANDPQPSFTADESGDYVVNLVVNDGIFDSPPDPVEISCNFPPSACAGDDRSVSIGESVTLDGICSSDPDFDSLTYAWTLDSQPAGSSASLNNSATRQPDLTPDVAGDYVIYVVVNDGLEDSEYADWVTVTATNLAPVAVVKANPTRLTIGATAVVDGSFSYDPEGYPLTVSWTISSQPVGSTPVLTYFPTNATFTIVPDLTGDYVIHLVVNDGVLDSYPDWVTITATNLPPVANAQADPTNISLGQSSTLDGTNSADPDGTIASYQWQQTAGPAVAITSNTGSTTAVGPFNATGTYTFQLTVTDNGALTDTDTVDITVSNHAPLAVAKSYPNNITGGLNSLLDGSDSYDPDGTIASYQWQRVSGPAAVDPWSPTAVTSAVGPLNTVGDYIYRLTVTDNGGLTYSDWTTVTVVDQWPVAVAKAMPNSLIVGDSTMLDGSLSSDHEGVLTYQWTESGSNPSSVTLGSSTAVYSTAGTFPIVGWYEFVLEVTDTYGHHATDFVTVYAEAATSCPTCPTNSEPTAEAGPNQNAGFYAWVELDGSASTDPDAGDTITHYFWQQVSGIPVSLEVGEWPNPVSFTAPNEVSDLVFSLVVSDGKSISYPDLVTISVWKDTFRSNTTGDPFIDARLDEPAALFVSQRGEDVAYCGDPVTTPCKTITYAIHSRFPTNVTADVYVGTWTQEGDPTWDTYYDASTGTYVENVALHDSTIDRGVSIFGGFFDDGTGNWWRDLNNYPTATTIQASNATNNATVACDDDTSTIEIENNVFIDGFKIRSTNSASQIFGVNCDTSTLFIRNNYIDGSNTQNNLNISIFLREDGSPTIINNFLFGGVGINASATTYGIYIYQSGTNEYGNNSLIAHNIIDGGTPLGRSFAMYIMGGANNPTKPTIMNNIINPGSGTGGTFGIYEEQSNVEPDIITNNIWTSAGGSCLYCDECNFLTSTENCLNTITQVNDEDNAFNNLSVNPDYVDQASGDFHLKKNSLCIDSGTNPGIFNDKGMNRRPVDVKLPDGTDVDNNPLDTDRNVFDIGPYEYPNPVSD